MLFSPYIFAWAFGNKKDHTIHSLSNCCDLNLKSVTLAFLVSDRYEEILQWKEDIAKHRNSINVRLSIGGAMGKIKAPQETCEEAGRKIASLIEQLEFIRSIDLDIEGESLTNVETVSQWCAIIEEVVRSCKYDLSFTLTLPVEFEGGMNKDALHAVNSFMRCKSITVNTVNLMLMDFYTPLEKGKSWAQKHIEILNYVHDHQLSPMGLSWSNMGICPMIGTNDDKTKFTLKDWDQVTDFAITRKIALISFWALNRDRKLGWLQSICGIDGYSKCQDKDFAYANTILQKLQ